MKSPCKHCGGSGQIQTGTIEFGQQAIYKSCHFCGGQGSIDHWRDYEVKDYKEESRASSIGSVFVVGFIVSLIYGRRIIEFLITTFNDVNSALGLSGSIVPIAWISILILISFLVPRVTGILVGIMGFISTSVMGVLYILYITGFGTPSADAPDWIDTQEESLVILIGSTAVLLLGLLLYFYGQRISRQKNVASVPNTKNA